VQKLSSNGFLGKNFAKIATYLKEGMAGAKLIFLFLRMGCVHGRTYSLPKPCSFLESSP
jgi:hypothetical protein